MCFSFLLTTIIHYLGPKAFSFFTFVALRFSIHQVFLWENGQKSDDLTDHLGETIFIEDRLDESLDTGQITLEAMPIDTKNAYPPKTKIRLERYGTNTYTDVPKIFDFVVEHDDVELYTGVPSICCHRIHLIEASVVAQGMHCDNIALTYELQDVDLNYRTIKDDSTVIGDNPRIDKSAGYDTGIRQTDDLRGNFGAGSFYFTDYFRNSYRYVWDKSSLSQIENQFKELDGSISHKISFDVPKLYCQGANQNGAWVNVERNLFEMNTITRVYRYKRKGEQVVSDASKPNGVIATKYSGPTSITASDDDVYWSDGSTAKLRAIDDWEDKNPARFSQYWSTLSTISTVSQDYTNKTVSFDTEQLSIEELDVGYNYTYQIESVAYPTNNSGMIEFYEKMSYAHYWNSGNPVGGAGSTGSARTTANKVLSPSLVTVNATISVVSKLTSNEGGAFLMKGVKYSCFELLRRALLTIDTKIIDNTLYGLDSVLDDNFVEQGIQYPIIVHPDWNNRLKTAKMQETIFEQKNLWEILIQIGYYLHAIPYLEFATDGTDRFILSFRQLGDSRIKSDTSNKLTVFNSRNISEYFTQYDAYVTNMFSPQNIVDEWMVCKTSDSSYLVSNDTAELITSRPITEILEFDIYYKDQKADALQYIFEQSVYQILTSDNPQKIIPAKGNAIYYTLGSNKIQGLTFVPPQSNSGTFFLAMQEIARRLFGTMNGFVSKDLLLNSLKFHIKYRTQDSMRINQVRPDLQNFIKNSKYETYPHHEQFYGQQDKIVDSERFSQNLWGKLIRVGNALYQCQEYVSNGDEKEAGDLVTIDGENYYVTVVENEYYHEAIMQKVTYSKNFNQLANIVVIPAEPRFYEVSERSKIRREVRIMEFFELSTRLPTQVQRPKYLPNDRWKDFVKSLIFDKDRRLPNFAYTKFLADYKRKHTGSYGQTKPSEELFPSSEVDRADGNNLIPQKPKDYADNITTLLYYPLHDGMVFEWDMEDNFKAGDFIDTTQPKESGINPSAFFPQQPLRYVDILGRADLFQFKLFYKDDWTFEQAQSLPKAVVVPSDIESVAYIQPDVSSGRQLSIALDKDNREELSFNYQINLLHRANDNDDDFITFPNLFGQKDSNLYMCVLDSPQSAFNENIDLSGVKTIRDKVEFSIEYNNTSNFIELKILTIFNDEELSLIKSIVLYQEMQTYDSDGNLVRGEHYAYICKNISKLHDSEKLQPWYIYPVYSE